MRAPLSWIREFAALPESVTGRDLAEALIRQGLEVETVHTLGAGCFGPILVGRVTEIEDLTEFRKPIRYCRVDLGAEAGGHRGIVCGAQNFGVGDTVVVALPGATLAGGVPITERETYGRLSEGMVCSERELGIGEDAKGIIVLPAGAAVPGTYAGPLLGMGEEVLDIAVTPDRGYALSIRGVAREAAAAFDVAFTDPGSVVAELPAPDASSGGRGAGAGRAAPVECRSDDADGCRLLTIRTMEGFDAAAHSPAWIRARLTAAGMRPINVVVDVTNYVMLETGQPLHAFDADKVSGALVARRAVSGECLTTLDGVERDLHPDDLVIADDSGPVALAGTMGGASTEISAESRRLALEAANFDAITVAKMSRRHRLSSEASRRFERGVDPVLAPYASQRATAMIISLAGGTTLGMTGQEYAIEDVVIDMPVGEPAAVAGTEIAPETAIAKLTAVGCHVERGDGSLLVRPASWRPDIRSRADLVEEVLRLVGYDAIPSRLPKVPVGGGLTRRQRMRRAASRAAAEFGLVEVMSAPFVGHADLDRLGIPPGDPRRNALALANPLSDERPDLRPTLLPGLLETAARNISRGHESVLLFETGVVFWPADGCTEPMVAVRPGVADRPTDDELIALAAALPTERRHIGAVLCGSWERDGWWGGGRAATWADAIQAARFVGGRIGSEIEAVADGAPIVDAAGPPPWHPTRCARLTAGGQHVGRAGQMHPRVAAEYGLPGSPSMFEMDLDVLIDVAAPVPRAPDVWAMPVAKEDVALVVNEWVPSANVSAAIERGAGPLLESVRLFDVYRGPQVGEGRKSLAFTLRFRAPDRTLTSAEVARARKAAVDAAREATGAELRA